MSVKADELAPTDSSPVQNEVTQEDIESWLEKSVQVTDAETALAYAQRVTDVIPDDVRAQEILQASIFEILDRDAFLGFIAETDTHYIITFRGSRPVFVPKSRAQREMYPPPAYSDAERALGSVWWLLAGLIPAGIGAFFLSLLTASRSFRVLARERVPPGERRMAWLALIFAAGAGLASVVLMFLLAIHFL